MSKLIPPIFCNLSVPDVMSHLNNNVLLDPIVYFECDFLKNHVTLMKLWGWAQDNVSDSDMKARITGVQNEMQTSSFFYGLLLAIIVLSHSDNLIPNLQRAELCAVDAQRMPSFLSLFFEVYDQIGIQASIGPR